MSDQAKQPSSGGQIQEADRYPKTYWEFMNRLALLVLAMSGALAWIPDVPPEIQTKAELVLYRVPLMWGTLVALPWLLKNGWQNRAKLRAKLQERRAPTVVTGENEEGTGILRHMKAMVGQVEQHLPHGVARSTILPAPLQHLPHNPNPVPTAPLTAQNASALITTALQLAEFVVDEEVQVLKVESGPVLQMITFQLPPKVQLSKLAAKKEDIANHLGKQQGFDVKAAKDFKSAASFVIPHAQHERAFVYMRDLAPILIDCADKYTLPVIFGKDIYGAPLIQDLAKMPHLLVCGATGSGKSVFVNTLLASLTSIRSPDQLKLLLIDPKQVEFGVYRGLPHLIAPPVTDIKRAVRVLYKVIDEMEMRYQLFSESNTRNLSGYNAKVADQPLPSIVVVIDEYADLMMVAGDAVEDAVQRITQKARAAGIHLVLGTQRPSVNVVTGTIKSNLPSRVAFKLPGAHDYRTVLDRGAPHLLGYGDGICMVQDGDLQRFQSAAISVRDGEDTAFIEQLIAYWSEQVQPDQSNGWSLDENDEEDVPDRQGNGQQEHKEEASSKMADLNNEEIEDLPWAEEEHEAKPNQEQISSTTSATTLYDQALAIVKREGGFSISTMQRELRISYSESLELIESMSNQGIIGPYDTASKWRPLIKTTRTQEELLNELKVYICQTGVTQSAKLREEFGVKRDTILDLLRILTQEGFLAPPTSTKTGYQIKWTDEQIEEFLDRIES